MYALYRGWADDYLDYPMLDRHVRIDVQAWAVLSAVTDQYYVRRRNLRPSSLRMLATYIGKVGVRGALAKVVSRLKEKGRNEKYVAVGFGVISQTAMGAEMPAGSFVAFLATNHPRCVDRVVVDRRFVLPWHSVSDTETGSVRFFPSLHVASSAMPVTLPGWLPYSGHPVDRKAVRAFLEESARAIERCLTTSTAGERFDVPFSRPVRERTPSHRQTTSQQASWRQASHQQKISRQESSPPESRQAPPRPAPPRHTPHRQAPQSKPQGVLFGLGQYAKVHILPNIRSHIDVRKIHEIDPMQIGPVQSWNTDLDTHPLPRDDEHFDVYFVAGYHHLHTPIAVHALKRGAYAVVEKPLATTLEQLRDVETAVRGTRSLLFVGFHKRYTAFNRLIKTDLKIHPGDPVNYHALIHEMPLPKNHWYTWPHSTGRMVTNGCHWIDHFFFLNDYARVREQWAHETAGGDIAAVIHLENGACCTITLSAFGSSRYGEREYVEVTTSSGMARIIDGRRYESENAHRRLRRTREYEMALYRTMYRRIASQISEGKEGDASRTLASNRCALDLQDQINPVT